MGTIKHLIKEDWERVSLLDVVYIEEHERELMQQLMEEETQIVIKYGRKQRHNFQQAEIRIKRPRFLKRKSRSLSF